MPSSLKPPSRRSSSTGTPEPQSLADVPSRKEALLECFKRLDRDGSGYIEFNELRDLAVHVTPKRNLEDAQDLLRAFDQDRDGRICVKEFLGLMEPLMSAEAMGPATFEAHIGAILHSDRPDEALNEPGYKHRQDSRAYLSSAVVPTLRQGLLELAAAIQQARLELAAGTQSDEDGYMPQGWRPFSPLRWLGEWILNHPDSSGTEGAQEQAQGDSSTVEDWLSRNHDPTQTFAALTRHSKIALAFKHLDRDGSGCLDATELLAVSGRLHREQEQEHARRILHSMDVNKDGVVDFGEYCHFLLKLTESLTNADFDNAMHKLMGAKHFAYCKTRADRLRFLFYELNQDDTGVLPVTEVEAIARRISPEATPAAIEAALEAFKQQDNPCLDVNEFVAVMEGLVAHVDDETALESLVAEQIEGHRVAAAPCDPADEVEPRKLQKLVRGLPSAKLAMQVSATEVMDALLSGAGSPLVLVDVRRQEEVEVSTIPGAVHCEAFEQPSLPHGWDLRNLERVKQRFALLEVLPGGGSVAWASATAAAAAAAAASHNGQAVAAEPPPPPAGTAPRLVLFCNTGDRANSAAVVASERLGFPAGSLCGGILNFYNQGGSVVDAEGNVVQAVHPGPPTPDLQRMVTRPNSFKLPHADGAAPLESTAAPETPVPAEG